MASFPRWRDEPDEVGTWLAVLTGVPQFFMYYDYTVSAKVQQAYKGYKWFGPIPSPHVPDVCPKCGKPRQVLQSVKRVTPEIGRPYVVPNGFVLCCPDGCDLGSPYSLEGDTVVQTMNEWESALCHE